MSTDIDKARLDRVAALPAVAPSERDTAKPPQDRRTVLDLVHGHGVAKNADRHPAVNLAASTETPIAVDLQRVHRASLSAGRADKSARRMAVARARAARAAQFEQLAATAARPDPARLKAAWAVAAPLTGIVQKIAATKKAWAARFLGSVIDDVAQNAIEKIVTVLAASDKDPTLLAQAAGELAEQARRYDGIPGDQLDDAQRSERNELAKARKWLMGMVHNRVMGALSDAYTERHNLRWANLDLLSTIMAVIAGARVDPQLAKLADRGAHGLGQHPARNPGEPDISWLSVAISAAITDRHLDALAELLLDHLRTDGSFPWVTLAKAVFLTGRDGPARWDLVHQATAQLSDPRKARADAARAHVRNQFAFLPELIADLQDALALRVIGYTALPDGTSRATVARTLDRHP